MRKGRFTEEQMVAIIREADREPVAAVSKRHGVSEQAIYTWRKRFGGFEANDVRRLRQLEAENARLKKLVAERDLDLGGRHEGRDGPAEGEGAGHLGRWTVRSRAPTSVGGRRGAQVHGQGQEQLPWRSYGPGDCVVLTNQAAPREIR